MNQTKFPQSGCPSKSNLRRMLFSLEKNGVWRRFANDLTDTQNNAEKSEEEQKQSNSK